MLSKYQKEIAVANKEILNLTKSDITSMNEIIEEYFSAGGKRVRMLLALIFSKTGNFEKNSSHLIKNAAFVELIHTTSLIHDDIIDRASERRNRPTLNLLHGNKRALFIGDYLFSKILYHASFIENVEFHDYLADTLKELCRGELLQNSDLYNINTRIIDYLKKIRRKTAILIAFSCVSASILAGADKKLVSASYKFGYYLGMSYQIMDDYLDFFAEKDILGKDIGQDLMSGNITLPIILKIKKDSQKFSDYKNLSILEKEILIKEIQQDTDLLDTVKNLSNKYLEKALESTNYFDEQIREELMYIVEKMRIREK